MLLPALRRLILLGAAAVIVTAVVSLLLGLVIGAGALRSLALGFYLVGSFLLVAGFFVGNRGPARVKDDTAGPTVLPIPGFGARSLRWATQSEQNESINNSAVFIGLGLALVVIGVAFDTHHSLF